ncbi:MAG TPA: SMP-30/gluconolactonase/LRE family protein [Conexibacter sp.]|nr:SMP-30/gluconolactonase/LRE family protein [Conexibacter sp.]
MDARLPLDRATAFFSGAVHEPQLNHPEGLAIDREGNVWCGGTAGEIYRIAADGSQLELIASTGGLILGMAFDRRGLLYVCDIKTPAVLRLDPATGVLEPFAKPRGERAMELPNFPVVDHARNCLYVSDSHTKDEPGGGVWRFDLDSGEGELWWDEPLGFANGMALDASGDALYVVESYAYRVSVIRIGADGAPTGAEPFLEELDGVVDGLAFDAEGRLYLSYFSPSRIARVDPDGRIELLMDDPCSHVLCQPANVAWRGTDLFAANLGGFHITRIELGVEGLPLV